MSTRNPLFYWFFILWFSLLTVPGWPLHIYLEQAEWITIGDFSYTPNKHFSKKHVFHSYNQLVQKDEIKSGTAHDPDSCVFCAFFYLLSVTVFVLLLFAILILIKIFINFSPSQYVFVKRLRVICARAPPF